MAYLCWGEDREDLTSQVEAARAAQRLPTAMLSDGTVHVRCSRGHTNVFGPPLTQIDLVESRNDD